MEASARLPAFALEESESKYLGTKDCQGTTPEKLCPNKEQLPEYFVNQSQFKYGKSHFKNQATRCEGCQARIDEQREDNGNL
jgi:hypothetical protein